MSYLYSFLRYQTKCVIKFLFRQLMISLTLRFIFLQPLKAMAEKDGNVKIQKFEYLENEKRFLDEIEKDFSQFLKCYHLVRNKYLIENSVHKL